MKNQNKTIFFLQKLDRKVPNIYGINFKNLSITTSINMIFTCSTCVFDRERETKHFTMKKFYTSEQFNGDNMTEVKQTTG